MLLWLAAVLCLLPTAVYAEYLVQIDGKSFKDLDDARMLAVDEADGVVYRFAMNHVSESVSLRVVSLRDRREVQASLEIQPRLRQFAVEYDPSTNTLRQLPGLWHTFDYEPERAVQQRQNLQIKLAGDFNGWSISANPFKDRGDGVYQVITQLTEGVHHYKIVLQSSEGTQWIPDPQSDPQFNEGDNFGGYNSGVFIGIDASRLPAPKSNHISKDLIRFNPSESQNVNIVNGELVRFRLKAQSGDVEQVTLFTRLLDSANQRGDWVEHQMLYSPGSSATLGFDAYELLLKIDGPFEYVIDLVDGRATTRISQTGVHDTKLRIAMPPLVCDMEPDFHTPDWAKHAVWYQIFAERFRNGDPSNDPGDTMFETLLPWEANWWETHTDLGEVAGQHNFYTGHGNVWRRRFGGDLQGVWEKLPYLRELGINAIYFNPMFEAYSMHKYDTNDFRHIDDNFGVKNDVHELEASGVQTDDPATWQWTASDRLFLDFMQAAREQGFRIVIDGVFNHTGTGHFAFVDVLKHGKNSQYADWFDIFDWGNPELWGHDQPFQVHGRPGGIQWRAWDQDNGSLPTFKKDPVKGLAEGPYNHIFAITKRWLDPNGDGDPSDGIDGWRLDVPGDIPHPFWIEWRKLVKETNPEAYITGEIWSYAQPWLRGDQFDAVMNYQFAMAAQDFFVDTHTGLTPTQFAARTKEVINAYPLQVSLAQQNLFDSHDTDRLASMFVNNDLRYDGQNRLQDTGPNYSDRKPNATEWARMKQAIAFQMSFVGAPMIYYGTEAGMWSPDDPSNRQPMIWRDLLPYDDKRITFNDDLFEFFQRTIALRHQTPALRIGAYRVLLADDDKYVFGFARQLEGEAAIVVVNRSDRRQRVRLTLDESLSSVSQTWVDWLDEDSTALVVDLKASADARPYLELTSRPDIVRIKGDEITLELKPWQTVVLRPE